MNKHKCRRCENEIDKFWTFCRKCNEELTKGEK